MIPRVLSATLFLKMFLSCLFYSNSYFGHGFTVMALGELFFVSFSFPGTLHKSIWTGVR